MREREETGRQGKQEDRDHAFVLITVRAQRCPAAVGTYRLGCKAPGESSLHKLPPYSGPLGPWPSAPSPTSPSPPPLQCFWTLS